MGRTMKRFLLRWLAPVVLATLLAGVSFGQRAAPPPAPTPESTGDEHGQPVFQYFVVVAASILVLFIVCKPSRKTQ